MKFEQLKNNYERWCEENSCNVQAKEMNAQFISVEEIYSDNRVGVNRSYYMCMLDASESKNSLPVMFLFSRLDLIEIDFHGNIISVKPIDYQII